VEGELLWYGVTAAGLRRKSIHKQLKFLRRQISTGNKRFAETMNISR
jgi:hypothetical protein